MLKGTSYLLQISHKCKNGNNTNLQKGTAVKFWTETCMLLIICTADKQDVIKY